MNGFLQLICPVQGPSALRPAGLSEFINTRAGSLQGKISQVPTKRQVENLPPQESWYVSWKPRVEFVVALMGLIVTAPMILLAATLIKLTSRGPAFYTQIRLGKDGRRFTIYKLRTMHHRAEAATGPIWAAPGDQRVSAVGKLLRATHLDELPQLVNVLTGDMSLIGPRPERPEIVHQLQTRILDYLHRLALRPGITGLAQVQLPPDIDLEGVRKKLICDLHYIKHFGFWLDFRLVLATGLLFIGIPLRWSRSLLRIPQPRQLHMPANEGSKIEDRVLKVEKAAARLSNLDLRSSIFHSSCPENWSACLPFSSRPESKPVMNVLSIDVEDYYQVTNFEDRVERREWDKYPSRVVANTRRLLALLDRRQQQATFFVLGWVGRRFPGLVREIVRAGHEVGCHSYWHRLIYQQTPREFRDDLRLARDVLEDAGGEPVTAYRAPSYSITRESLWALDILHDEGFRFDSSIFPTHHPVYGIPEAKSYPHRLHGDKGGLWEFPPSVVRVLGLNVPVAGGGYFRLYPASWTAHCFRRINRLGHPAVSVIHPWEIDPDQPRLARFTGRAWHHYLNLKSTEKKLDWLLGQFTFGAISQVAQRCASQEIILPMHRIRPS